MSDAAQKTLEKPESVPEHKTIRNNTHIGQMRRARVWALVRLKGMSVEDAYRAILPHSLAQDAESKGQAMVDAFELSAGDNLSDALTAADLGMARLLREIDSSLKSEKPQTYNAALRLLADLHKRPTVTAPKVAPVMIEKGLVVVPGEMSVEDWTKQNFSAK